ncbi:MAG: TIGR04086 family membrane protein [Mycoplasmatota bacterium]
MKVLKKITKSIALMIILLISLTFILSVLYYFNIVNASMNSILKILIPSFSFLITGLYVGKNSLKKGWLEGLKISFILLIILILFGYLLFNYQVSFKNFLYFLILISSSTLGSMIGINIKKN